MNRARRRYVRLILTVCALMAVLETAHAMLVARVHGDSAGLLLQLLRHLPPWIALAGLIPLVGHAARRLPLDGPRPLAHAAAHALLGMTFPVVHLSLTGLVRTAAGDASAVSSFPSDLSWGTYLLEVLLYWLIAGAHMLHDLRVGNARAVAEAEALRQATHRLEGSLASANLQALRWQLNPHFLFNALNTLSVLAADARADRVVDVIGTLSALLRSALEQPAGTTTLEQEVRFLARYLDFERVRFEDRLDVEWDISGECLQAVVPALVLQPLVENAIKHGVDRDTSSVSLVIGAARSGGRIRLWVADHGPGLQHRSSEHDGIGLRNTRDRLLQLFGDRCALHVASGNGRGVTATIMIPWQKSTDRSLQEVRT